MRERLTLHAQPYVARACEHVIAHVLYPRIERINKATKISYEKEFYEQYQRFIRNGYIPFVYANHQSHFDIYTMAKVTEFLTKVANVARPQGLKPFQGFMLPFASSIATGHQGALMQAVVDSVLKASEARKLYAVAVTRPKDRALGVPRDFQRSNFRFIRAAQHGFARATFPEATVEGGRNYSGDIEDIQGIQKIDDPTTAGLIFALQRLGEKILFVPAGFHGGYRVFNPTTRRPTIPSTRAAFFGDAQLVEARVGIPFTDHDLIREVQERGEEVTAEAIYDHLMARVAPLVPEHARGYLRDQ